MERSILLAAALLVGLIAPVVHAKNSHNHGHGPKGDQGAPGLNGSDGQNGVNGADGLNSEAHKTSVSGRLGLRLLDTKHLEAGLYGAHDFRGYNNHEYGAYLNIKIGKSYEERRIENLEYLLKRHLDYIKTTYKRSELLPEEK